MKEVNLKTKSNARLVEWLCNAACEASPSNPNSRSTHGGCRHDLSERRDSIKKEVLRRMQKTLRP